VRNREGKWRFLFEVALTDRNRSQLPQSIAIAEAAMLARVQDLLNAPEEGTEYEELMEGMKMLYEHGLRNGLNLRRGTSTALPT
jgi:hypothetical protein